MKLQIKKLSESCDQLKNDLQTSEKQRTLAISQGKTDEQVKLADQRVQQAEAKVTEMQTKMEKLVTMVKNERGILQEQLKKAQAQAETEAQKVQELQKQVQGQDSRQKDEEMKKLKAEIMDLQLRFVKQTKNIFFRRANRWFNAVCLKYDCRLMGSKNIRNNKNRLSQQIESSENEANTLKQQLQVLQSKSGNEASQKQIEILNNENESLRKEANELKDNLSDLLRNLEFERSQLKQAQDLALEMRKSDEAKIESLKNEIEAVSASVLSLVQDIVFISSDIYSCILLS